MRKRFGLLALSSTEACYPESTARFAKLAHYLAFYALRAQCFVGDEQVQAQRGSFYGGWVTSEIVGPLKGAPGIQGW